MHSILTCTSFPADISPVLYPPVLAENVQGQRVRLSDGMAERPFRRSICGSVAKLPK
jgi:hypothetical protein